MEGVNSVIKFCFYVFHAWHLFISLVFHSCSNNLNSVNVVPLINLLHAFFYKQTFKALKLRSYGPYYGIRARLTVVQVCECLPGPG